MASVSSILGTYSTILNLVDPLLSNIFAETENPDGLRQTAVYRTRRNFNHFLLRGKPVALLSRPLFGMPYQLMVYYNLSRSETAFRAYCRFICPAHWCRPDPPDFLCIRKSVG